MDLRTAVMASVAASQSAFVPQAGDAFILGARLCFVASVSGESVELDTDDGQRETWTVAELRGRSISPVTWRAPSARSMTPADVAWEVAGTRTIPAGIRAAYVLRWADRATDDAQKAQMLAWASALLRGGEPVR